MRKLRERVHASFYNRYLDYCRCTMYKTPNKVCMYVAYVMKDGRRMVYFKQKKGSTGMNNFVAAEK